MCTLIVIKNLLQDAPLILAANRDEAYVRPWNPPSRDLEPPRVWRPIDRSAGGTWIGINDENLAVAVTNRRPVPPVAGRRSRGLLCADILKTADVQAACTTLQDHLESETYNDFNMVMANAHEACVLHHEANQTRIILLPDGVHILSNFHDLDDPVWHATRTSLTRQAKNGWHNLQRALHAQLASHTPAADGHLTCKHGQHYGTLCSSIIRICRQTPPTFHFSPGPPCTTPFTPPLT